MISLSWTVENQSTSDATPSWYDKLYLSTDAAGNSTDRLLTSVWRSTLKVGNSYVVTMNVRLPSVAAGSYHLILRADDASQTFESDETNNVRTVPFSLN